MRKDHKWEVGKFSKWEGMIDINTYEYALKYRWNGKYLAK